MPGFEVINKEEKKAVVKIFDEGGVLFAHGFENLRKKFHIREFEKNFSRSMGCKHSLAVTSGTAAIKIGLKALGVKAGDEVITQSFNFIATIEAILDIGAKPIMININENLNMDLNELKNNITKKTKVILPVHMLGNPCEMNEIIKISKKYNLKILEDNCEAIGGKYKNKNLGTLGDIGVFSFDFGKTITTGEGGMIITNNKRYYDYCNEYHDHGHQNLKKFSRGNDKAKMPGFNYRMTEMQGAIGKVQLKKLNKILVENKKRYVALKEKISKSYDLRIPPKMSQESYDVLIIKNVKSNTLKKKILKILIDGNFGTKNLPGAIRWHCSYYWKHAIGLNESRKNIKTKVFLENSIAIPIWLKKSVNSYKYLGDLLKKI
ncbi:DegT/DnrJ/EryC1/StrS family aminotransferase [Candidatus Pelagibacter sp.]|jgi:8-amino-3,8-dideoxy-alpha-D-manno-octulosonate transaminase|nr:DegT/DnrJ/EryC1/StrS family aminotransferase [Candidatus Pelagibacter sp.]